MSLIFKILMLALSAAFLENTIFLKAFGSSTLLMVTKDKKSIIPFGLSITYFCVTTSLLSYVADRLLLDVKNNDLYYPVVYVLIMGIVYMITLLVIWKFFYNFFMKTKAFMHLAAFNCAVLGSMFINSMSNRTLLGYVIFGFGTGLGFFAATFILSVSYKKLTSEDVPASFRGFPATMIYIGIISMVFYVLSVSSPKI